MPESQNIEWKSKWKDDYLEWICGYANAQGGKIYIGCDDDGNVIGLPNAHKLLEDIPNKIRDAMGIIVGVNLYEQNGKEYIEVDVPSYPIGISCKGVYYYRSGSCSQKTQKNGNSAHMLKSDFLKPTPIFYIRTRYTALSWNRLIKSWNLYI